VQRLGAFLRQYGFDLVLVLILLLGLFEVTRADADVGAEAPRWLIVSGVVVIVLPLFARRSIPFLAPALVWLIGAGLSFVDGSLATTTYSVYSTGVVAAYLLGNLPDSRRARSSLAIVLVGAAIVVYNDPSTEVSDFVTVPATFAVAWLAGFALRERAALVDEAEQRALTAERDREAVARIAVAEERSRITRELHDVVAHAVSVMVLQVGAVRHRLPDTRREDKEALQTVEDTGRSALTEMRRLLGVIHDDDRSLELSPQPGLDRLDSLAEEVRLTGLDVRVQRQGQPVTLPRALDLSAYRIVQEGLTNCLKHSGATVVDVTVRYTPYDLEIEVVDDGVGSTKSDGMGRGMTGVRERVKIYGGEMTTGPGPDGGFRLQVRLPVREYPR
jgi:signal transduction histidine kinase